MVKSPQRKRALQNPPLELEGPVALEREPNAAKAPRPVKLMKFDVYFPIHGQSVLYPMWDPMRMRWFAGAAMWSHSPLRVFSPEGELAYLVAFCDVVMAKIARREARLTDQAKSNFISSVSHELRYDIEALCRADIC